MAAPASFYHAQLEKYQVQLKVASKKLLVSSVLRLVVFLGIVAIIYFFFGAIKVLLPAVLLEITIFVWLVSRHSDLKYERDKFRELLKINETELAVLNRDFYQLPTGEEFENPAHPYSQDIDLFGKGSFF